MCWLRDGLVRTGVAVIGTLINCLVLGFGWLVAALLGRDATVGILVRFMTGIVLSCLAFDFRGRLAAFLVREIIVEILDIL